MLLMVEKVKVSDETALKFIFDEDATAEDLLKIASLVEEQARFRSAGSNMNTLFAPISN